MEQATLEKLKNVLECIEIGSHPIELANGKKATIIIYDESNKKATKEEIEDYKEWDYIRKATAKKIIEDVELPDESDLYSMSDGKPLV